MGTIESKAEDLEKNLLRAQAKARAILAREAPNDYPCFARYVLKDEETSRHIVLAPHQLEWFDHIDRCLAAGKFAGILAPPSSGKSQLISVGYPLWQLGRLPTARICVVASDNDLAKKRVTPAKDYLERDPDYPKIFPDAKPSQRSKWTEQEFTVKRPAGIKDPSYQGRGIKQPPHGARIDLLINDDVCDIQNTIMSPADREKTIELWYNGFDTRLGKKSFALHIGGILHSRDLNNRLINDQRFWFLKQSISADFCSIEQENLATGEMKKLPLWDRAWNPTFLRAKCQANARAFNRAYRHVGYTDDERTFKAEAIKAAIRRGLADVPPNAPRYIGVDLGTAKNRPANVIFTFALIGTRRRVIDIDLGNWDSVETARRIRAGYFRHKPIVIMVENNAYQQAILDWMKADQEMRNLDPIPLEAFTTGKQKADELLGVPGLAAEFENGMWEIPFDDDHVIGMGCKCGPCTFIVQLGEHPFGPSDTVMAGWFARAAAMKYGPSSTEIEFVQGKDVGRKSGSARDQHREGKSRISRFRGRRP